MPYVDLVARTLGLAAIWMSYRTRHLRVHTAVVEEPDAAAQWKWYLPSLEKGRIHSSVHNRVSY